MISTGPEREQTIMLRQPARSVKPDRTREAARAAPAARLALALIILLACRLAAGSWGVYSNTWDGAGAPGSRYRAPRSRASTNTIPSIRRSGRVLLLALGHTSPGHASFGTPAAERHAGRHRYPVLRRPLRALSHALPGQAVLPFLAPAAACHLVVGRGGLFRSQGRGAPQRGCCSPRLPAVSRTRSARQPRCGGGCDLPARALHPAIVAGGVRACATAALFGPRRWRGGRHENSRPCLSSAWRCRHWR